MPTGPARDIADLPLLNRGYAALGVDRLWRRPAHTFDAALRADLRTDHAGETGAVMIYRGILALSRDPGVREFAQLHLATESRHLALIEGVLPAAHRSRLLRIWRIAGWLTGGLPSLAGPTAVYTTIAAVETFVDRHYAEQIRRIDAHEDAAHNSGCGRCGTCWRNVAAMRWNIATRRVPHCTGRPDGCCGPGPPSSGWDPLRRSTPAA